jgi:hypothetical protein
MVCPIISKKIILGINISYIKFLLEPYKITLLFVCPRPKPESWNSGARRDGEGTATARQRPSKHDPMAVNTHTTI